MDANQKWLQERGLDDASAHLSMQRTQTRYSTLLQIDTLEERADKMRERVAHLPKVNPDRKRYEKLADKLETEAFQKRQALPGVVNACPGECEMPAPASGRVEDCPYKARHRRRDQDPTLGEPYIGSPYA